MFTCTTTPPGAVATSTRLAGSAARSPPTRPAAVTRRKQPYKITYPNGKIYVGMDLTGTLTYFGGPCTVWPHSRHVQVVCSPP